MKIITVDVLIIGGGQAGLLTAYYFKQRGKVAQVVDSNSNVGDAWRNRYDCLRLLTPWKENFLPGLTVKNDPMSYPTKNEYASYLKLFARKFKLAIHHNTEIKKLTKKHGYFYAYAGAKLYKAKTVIIATGAFQRPYIPPEFMVSGYSGVALHTAAYKNTGSISQKKVLVVGGGYSGIQIAADLAGKKNVTLALSKKLFFSNRYDIFYRVAHALLPEKGIKKILSILKIRKVHTPETEKLFNDKKIIIKPRLTSVKKNIFFFADGSSDVFDAVIWATGYRFDFSWIKIPAVFNDKGEIKHKRGKCDVEGMHVIYPEGDYAFIRDLPGKVLPIVESIRSI